MVMDNWLYNGFRTMARRFLNMVSEEEVKERYDSLRSRYLWLRSSHRALNQGYDLLDEDFDAMGRDLEKVMDNYSDSEAKRQAAEQKVIFLEKQKGHFRNMHMNDLKVRRDDATEKKQLILQAGHSERALEQYKRALPNFLVGTYESIGADLCLVKDGRVIYRTPELGEKLGARPVRVGESYLSALRVAKKDRSVFDKRVKFPASDNTLIQFNTRNIGPIKKRHRLKLDAFPVRFEGGGEVGNYTVILVGKKGFLAKLQEKLYNLNLEVEAAIRAKRLRLDSAYEHS